VTVDASVIRLAQAFIVQIANNFAHTILTRLEVARMPHQVTKWTHVADIALTHEFARSAVELTSTVFARVEVNTRSLIVKRWLLHIHLTCQRELLDIFGFVCFRMIAVSCFKRLLS
jgi:hypothetical protein